MSNRSPNLQGEVFSLVVKIPTSHGVLDFDTFSSSALQLPVNMDPEGDGDGSDS